MSFQHSFTHGQYNALNEDLNFSPTLGYYSDKFKKSIIVFLVSFHTNEDTSENKSEDRGLIIKSKSDQEPKENHPTIEMFVEGLNSVVDRTF